MVKAERKRQILFITGNGINISQRFVHAAMFAFQHFLKLCFIQVFKLSVNPVTKLYRYFFCLQIIGVSVGIHQTGQNFMFGVPRNPTAIQIKTLRMDISRSNLVKNLVLIRDSAHISGFTGLLALGQLGHDVICFLFKLLVSGSCIHHGTSRKIMPKRMPGNPKRFPTGINFALWF